MFVFRRIVLLYAMFMMNDRPWLQVMIFMVLSLINLIYVGYSMPFYEKRNNVVEIIDESTISLIAILQMCLEMGTIEEIETKTIVGYSIIVLILANCAVSMYFVIKEMILALIEEIKEKWQQLKEKC